MTYYVPFVAAFFTILVIMIVLYTKLGKEIKDIPNERSMHSVPIPRSGGVGLMGGILLAWALMKFNLGWWLVLPMLGLFLISLLDDMRSLPVRWRLLAHLFAATLMVVGSGLMQQQGFLPALIVLFFTVWMTNLYNFMDGSDGLSGGMSFFGFSMYGIVALLAHNEQFAILNFSVAAAAAGFLCFNF
jgi:UDP-GlcNAc:undecaprenyl-phosphate/decaprenyl-phosphate GlcNAc-1-phosphate transferase